MERELKKGDILTSLGFDIEVISICGNRVIIKQLEDGGLKSLDIKQLIYFMPKK